MLVGAVVIHGPYFLVPAAAAHEINLAFRDPGNSAAQAEDNFIGKLVRGGAGGVAGGGILILLAQHLRRRHVLHIVEPALHRHAVAGHAQIAKSQHGRIGWGRAPALELHIRWRSHLSQGIETLRNHVEDAGIVQIVPQSFVERLQQVGILGILSGGIEIGDGQTHFFHAQARCRS